MELTNTTLLQPSPCTNEIVGFGVALGLSAASSIISWAFLYFCYVKPAPIAKHPCPYCQKPFEQAHIREHLQTCPEHLKTYTPKGRASMVQELDRKAFYSSSMKKLLTSPELHVEES